MALNLPQQWLLFCAALLGLFGVASGAFGAHALKQRLSQEILSIFEIGVRYQMYHVLAVCVAVWASTVTQGHWAMAGGWLFLAGILIFSGSLYILALTDVRAWGAVTPIGGFLFLLGWLCLAIAAFKS